MSAALALQVLFMMLGAIVGFLLGAVAATWGGHHGANCATWCEETTDVALSARDSSGLPIRRGPVAAAAHK